MPGVAQAISLVVDKNVDDMRARLPQSGVLEPLSELLLVACSSLEREPQPVGAEGELDPVQVRAGWWRFENCIEMWSAWGRAIALNRIVRPRFCFGCRTGCSNTTTVRQHFRFALPNI